MTVSSRTETRQGFLAMIAAIPVAGALAMLVLATSGVVV